MDAGERLCWDPRSNSDDIRCCSMRQEQITWCKWQTAYSTLRSRYKTQLVLQSLLRYERFTYLDIVLTSPHDKLPTHGAPALNRLSAVHQTHAVDWTAGTQKSSRVLEDWHDRVPGFPRIASSCVLFAVSERSGGRWSFYGKIKYTRYLRQRLKDYTET